MAPGVRLAVQESPGQEPATVLLHGLASTHHWWDLVTELLPGRRVVRWDHRGHGLSTIPTGRHSVEDLARDAAAVLDAAGLQQCIVAGHSLGAAVGLRLAADRPDLVAALCCVDGGLYDPQTMFGRSWWDAQPAMRLDRRIAPTEAMLTAWAHGIGLPAAAVPALLANYQPDPSDPRRVRLRLPAEHEGPLAYSLWSQRPADLLARVDVPVTAVLARTADRAAAAVRRRALHHTLDGAGRTVTERWIDGGHDLPLEQPHRVADAILDLLEHATLAVPAVGARMSA
ncbi:alpha/beta fold hydrolase [Dactylosporangium sp. CA-233914]|uniref:alpha/beta fold hydrolase n=1 Tax=Dactylosporangium sp. CA-233914 TaxID=3239934 RepID=UPI003D8A9DD5